MKKYLKIKYIPVFVLLLVFAAGLPSGAMHIMEGFVQPVYCIAWGVVCVPFIVLGIRSIKKIIDRDRKTIMLIAMCAAFAFVLSSFKIPLSSKYWT